MANVLIGGRHHAVSPYIALGAGLIRTDITGPSDVLDLHATENNWGGNIGGGVFIGSGKVTFRGDVRYFKSFETSGDFPEITGDKLGFWRATAGIGLHVVTTGSRQRSVQPLRVRSSATAPCCGNAASAPHISCSSAGRNG